MMNRADPNSSVRIVDVIVHPCVFEVTAARSGLALRGFFGNTEALTAGLDDLGQGWRFAFTPNPLQPEVLFRAYYCFSSHAKPALAPDVLLRRWLPVHADRRVARDVCAYVTARGWPSPHILRHGDEVWLLWRIDLRPHDDLAATVLAALAARFDIDRSADLNVRMPLPGHDGAEFIPSTDPRVARDQLEALAGRKASAA